MSILISGTLLVFIIIIILFIIYDIINTTYLLIINYCNYLQKNPPIYRTQYNAENLKNMLKKLNIKKDILNQYIEECDTMYIIMGKCVLLDGQINSISQSKLIKIIYPYYASIDKFNKVTYDISSTNTFKKKFNTFVDALILIHLYPDSNIMGVVMKIIKQL